MGRIVRGVVAGTAGTVALNAVTYLDMLVRGRPSSQLPGVVAEQLAADVGLDLTGSGEDADNRREALGALAGMVTGVGVAVVCSTVFPRLGRRRLLLPATVVGGLAAVGANGPLVAKGLTDPKQWDATAWASDLVPHLAYGLAVVASLRVLRHEPWRVTGEVLARVDGVDPFIVQ